ncbi:fad-linked sulfhydryl oxidase erv1 [Phtheirospermum japonicum]|uniref:Fad-linked sulfhydryl oxidase erv1 n=1 Tax=Phtheirospermum japonicum TaxID=374723 RepID=A0A830C8H8_9LAMI|nr:fad-linked sulfhydryl oxidase erv1 [Phtheirospermum japonicum]
MSENPLQLLFQAFDKVSECIQSHLSQFVLRPGGPSSSFSTNQNQIFLSLLTVHRRLSSPTGRIPYKGKVDWSDDKRRTWKSYLDFSSHTSRSVSG